MWNTKPYSEVCVAGIATYHVRTIFRDTIGLDIRNRNALFLTTYFFIENQTSFSILRNLCPFSVSLSKRSQAPPNTRFAGTHA